jgi:hypothetical protein
MHSYLALPDGAGGFRQGVSDPAVLRMPTHALSLCVQGYHLLRRPFPGVFRSLGALNVGPTTPEEPEPLWFGLVPVRSPLLGKSRFVFFSCRYLDVSVPRVCSLSRPPRYGGGFPIRKSLGQRLFAAYQSLSQLTTSFIADACQGILHLLFLRFLRLPRLGRSSVRQSMLLP